MRYFIGLGLLIDLLLWGPAIFHRVDNAADIACPAKPFYIRYPDGMHQAVCNPTGINWVALREIR